MERTCTSANGDPEPIPAPASRNIIRSRGRGRARGQGWGRGRIAASVEGQVLIATYCRDRTVPLDANTIQGDGPTQDPPSTISTIVLQDILARILGILQGMVQARAFPVTFDGSQTRIGA